MVKIGFICEGECEKIVLESEAFQYLLMELQVECIHPIIDAGGNGNLLPKNIDTYVNRLSQAGAQKIFVLTDLDLDNCISLTKKRILETADLDRELNVIVAVKQLESWFLADSEVLTKLLGVAHFEENPETINEPINTLNELCIKHTNRGLGSVKPRIARKMIGLGFTIEKAANHPNSKSAKYFIDKLKEIS